MSTRYSVWVVVFVLSLFAIGPEKANASCCGQKYTKSLRFNAGPYRVNIHNMQIIAQGGCRDCIDCAEVEVRAGFKCGIGQRQQAVLNLKPMDHKLPRWLRLPNVTFHSPVGLLHRHGG